MNPETAIKEYLERIENSKIRKNPFGRFITMAAYLASPELTPFWESSIMHILDVGHTTMVSVFDQALCNFLPIMRTKARSSMEINLDAKSVYGQFWSKGRGFPIWLSVSANEKDRGVEPPEDLKGDVLYEKAIGKLRVTVWKLVDVRRDKFLETIWDEVS